ncbi:MAG: putative ABC transporter permease [Coriobacteriales bacterium]|nr:putative ABC transporter permease [Coriobacteriales bacterium]
MLFKKKQVVIPEPIVDYINNEIPEDAVTDESIKGLVDVVHKECKKELLTDGQYNAIAKLYGERTVHLATTKTPIWLKIVAILAVIASIINVSSLFEVLENFIGSVQNGSITGVSSSIITNTILLFILLILGFVAVLLVAIFIIINKRRVAAKMLYVNMIITVLTIVVEIMVAGFEWGVIVLAVGFFLAVLLQAFLDPTQVGERKLGKHFMQIDAEERQKQGKQGVDISGKGYIRLDFYNLFWIFMIGSVIGLFVEGAFQVVAVSGHWQWRNGMLFGPFSPIYGFGAVLVTVPLNRFRNGNIIVLFIASTIICGAFEWFVSYFMEMSCGMKAWDYSDEFLNIGGRTCLWFAMMFAFLAVFYMRCLLPYILKLINKIPWKIRYSLTAVVTVLMIINGIMTMQAMDCWYTRVAGQEPVTEVQKFYAENFDNDWMQKRFENIEIDPEKAKRMVEG